MLEIGDTNNFQSNQCTQKQHWKQQRRWELPDDTQGDLEANESVTVDRSIGHSWKPLMVREQTRRMSTKWMYTAHAAFKAVDTSAAVPLCASITVQATPS
jgi:hypothetical protein